MSTRLYIFTYILYLLCIRAKQIVMPTHKKAHDKDKYYHLAKDQGYRSRAAYKLIQINKRYDFLTKARVCIDLCAAPGGWCQVAAKLMPQGSIVLGVDLLPIRALRNVKTLVQDITTAECRRLVTQELHGWKADVVLCDGAPNIGSAYSKDAYVQNELVIAALKTATEHLAEGGTFCTKVYRSKDYNALVWVLQQFFVDVQAMKPNSSRSQSAEIFLVGMKYLAPTNIDPKLLDPNHVFKEVANDPDGPKTVDVMHKKYDLHNKKSRTGYEDVTGGVLLSKTCTVTDFVKSKDAVRLLTDKNSFVFTDECKALYLDQPATTEEVQICFQDLRVLGRLDFKKLLKWRLLMIKNTEEPEDAMEVVEAPVREKKSVSALTEEEIQEEIQDRRAQLALIAQKQKKKTRLSAQKERRRQQLGMTSDSFGVDEDMELFSLNKSDTKYQSELEGVQEVDLEELEEGFDEDSEDEEGNDNGLIQLDDDALEDELESEYLRFASRQRAKGDADRKRNIDDEIREAGYMDRTTKRALKRALSEQVVKEKTKEDIAMQISEDVQNYAQMLNGPTGSDGESSSDDDEEEEDDDEEEEEAGGRKKRRLEVPINTKEDMTASAKADKWFNHPIFKESVVTSTAVTANKGKKRSKQEEPELTPEQEEEEARKALISLNIPVTDKEMRKMQRKKDAERKERRQEKKDRKNNLTNDEDGGNQFTTSFEIAPSAPTDKYLPQNQQDNDDVDLETAKMREMIRQGMGKMGKVKDVSTTFEIAPAAGDDDEDEEVQPRGEDDSDDDEDNAMDLGFGPMSKIDDRTYGSDEEDYDTYDKTMTLALGTMMLRGSRKKAMVDASYNRYAWNDPKDLPGWFADDEMKHNRPQLPVPNALIQQIKGKFTKTGTKEIKKVAEARMRKRKRAEIKLKTAKKEAKTAAENPDLSDKMKVRAIQRAMKGSKADKPSKVYVVARGSNSTGKSTGGSGKMKFVDSRMKNDTRAQKRNEKKAKKYGRKKK